MERPTISAMKRAERRATRMKRGVPRSSREEVGTPSSAIARRLLGLFMSVRVY
jgi:hypothetical protein